MANQLISIAPVVLILTLYVQPFNRTQFHQSGIHEQAPPQTLRLKATLTGHAKTIDRIAFTPDGKLVATSSEDHTIRIWDAYTGELKAILSGEDKAKWEQDRWYQYRPYITLHDFSPVFVGRLKQVVDSGATPKAISPDRRLLITVRLKDRDSFERDELLELWDITTGEWKLTFAKIPYGVTGVYWSPDGKSIIVEGFGRTKTRLMDVPTGRIKAKLPYETCTGDSWFDDNDCANFDFNADGSVFTKEKHPLKLWSTDTGELLAELKSSRPPALFSPTDKHLLVTKSKDKKTAFVWELTLK